MPVAYLLRTDEGRTALVRGAEYGQVRIVGLLIQARANINANKICGSTPLDAAIYWQGKYVCEDTKLSDSCRAVADLLVSHGALRQDESDRDGASQKLWEKVDDFYACEEAHS